MLTNSYFRTVFILIPVLLLTSCQGTVTAHFEVTNRTSLAIDSLTIEPNYNSEGKYISIQPYTVLDYEADMTGTPATDGDYQLSYRLGGEPVTKRFGYYTNGIPLENMTKIEIRPDTVLFVYVLE